LRLQVNIPTTERQVASRSFVSLHARRSHLTVNRLGKSKLHFPARLSQLVAWCDLARHRPGCSALRAHAPD